MVQLTPDQANLVEQVAAARRVQRTAKDDAEAAARKMVAERTAEADRALSRTIRRALDGGVPRLRVSRDGLGSKDTRTIDRFLVLTDEEARIDSAIIEQHAVERIRWATRAEVALLGAKASWADHVLRVDWPDYVPTEGTRLATYGETVQVHGFFRPGGRRGRKYTAVQDDLHDQWQADLKLDSLEQALLDERFQVAADRVAASL